MQGDLAYCKKHGHDWKLTEVHPGKDIVQKHEVCLRCGMLIITTAFIPEANDE